MDIKTVPVEYRLPYDSEEGRRLKLQHDALKYYAGGNLVQQVREALPNGPLRFLDIAGGSGIWAAEIATEHPNSEVIMMDMLEHDSRSVVFPPNCRFVKGDMTITLPFESNLFDCVQVRICPTVRDRVFFYQEVHRILKPGGLLQLVDIINYTSEMQNPPKPLLEMNRVVSVMCGLPPSTFNQDTWLLDPTVLSELEGGTDPSTGEKLWERVTRIKVTTPITGWPTDPRDREFGLGQAEQVQMLWKAFIPALLEDKIMNQAEIDVVTKELSQVLDSRPPPELSWGYHYHIAQKGLTRRGPEAS